MTLSADIEGARNIHRVMGVICMLQYLCLGGMACVVLVLSMGYQRYPIYHHSLCNFTHYVRCLCRSPDLLLSSWYWMLNLHSKSARLAIPCPCCTNVAQTWSTTEPDCQGTNSVLNLDLPLLLFVQGRRGHGEFDRQCVATVVVISS